MFKAMNAKDWGDVLSSEEAAHKDWRDKAQKVRDVYTIKDKDGTRFNIFWANVDVLHAALFSETPKPDVRRRFKDTNDTARDAAEVLERALEFIIDMYPFDVTMDTTIDDHLITALGQVRVIYQPYVEDGPAERIPLTQKPQDDPNAEPAYQDPDGVQHKDVLHDGDQPYALGEPTPEIVFQEISCECVPWDRFRWSPAKDWGGVWWAGEDHFLTDEECRAQLLLPADTPIPTGYAVDGEKNKDGENADKESRARVTEIWDKRHRERFAYIEGFPDKIKFKTEDGKAAEDDPLNLRNFWPYPMPLFANILSGDLIPRPDYLYYQDQALEMNELSTRIERLTRQLKYRGVYDGTFDELANIANSDDGVFVPIANFATRFAGHGTGLDQVLASMPLDVIMKVIQGLVEMRDTVKQSIYELTGISDIVRGATSPSETLGAQQLKGQFASMRLMRRQRRVEQFIREIFRIKAELISEHFEPNVLSMMTGIEVTPQIMDVLKSDVLREFNVDIETDSTVIADANMEMENRTKILGAVSELLTNVGPVLAQIPNGMELLKELILFALEGFKESRSIEQLFEEFNFEPPPAPPPEQPPPPSPQDQVAAQTIPHQVRKAAAEADGAEADAKVKQLQAKNAESGIDKLLEAVNGGTSPAGQ